MSWHGRDGTATPELAQIYSTLETTYSFSCDWPGGNWPTSGKFQPSQFEVVAGAILTQNTSWSNVERALDNLVGDSLTSADAIVDCPPGVLQSSVRCSGFYRQKADRLKGIARHILAFPGDFYSGIQREQLLSCSGIGPETADSILLYACGRLHFVVDAYTRRIGSRYGLFPDSFSYDEVQTYFEHNLPGSVSVYKRFHALLVEHAKRACRKGPRCEVCVLTSRCQRTRLAPS